MATTTIVPTLINRLALVLPCSSILNNHLFLSQLINSTDTKANTKLPPVIQNVFFERLAFSSGDMCRSYQLMSLGSEAF